MSVFFPVVQTGKAGVQVNSLVSFRPDTTESAWSMMQRLAIGATLAGSDTFTLTVNESTKVLTFASANTFNITIGGTYTGFVTSSGSNSYTSSAITDAVVVDGCALSGPGYMFSAGQPGADGAAAGGGLFRSGAVTVDCRATYAAAYAAAKLLRSGVWDVVDEGRWLVRIRSTGVQLIPQGLKQGFVTLQVNGQVVA